MTTYTLTVEQRGQLMTDLAKAYISSEALSMLQSLQPNTQEPVGEVQHLDELNEQWTKHLPIGTKLYTHPAPQQPAEPLTDEQINDLMQEADAKWSDADVPMHWARHFARAIEAAHGVKP